MHRCKHADLANVFSEADRVNAKPLGTFSTWKFEQMNAVDRLGTCSVADWRQSERVNWEKEI